MTDDLPMPPGASLSPGEGGLPRVAIDVPSCTGEIFLHGAHVTRWAPHGARPVLWTSRESRFEPGRPIRGGVPICFPWFGPHPAYPDRPPHGFARLLPWTLVEVARVGDAIRVALSLRTAEAQHALWPHPCTLDYSVLFGSELVLELAVRNAGDAPCTLHDALHTYFAVGDVRRVEVEGLGGETFVDKVRGGERAVQDDAPLRIGGETDRVYLATEATTTIVDPVEGRRIVVAKRGSRSTVVWNPWIAKAAAMPDFGDDEWTSMLCVETANALDDAVTLPPGGVHRLRAQIRVA